MVEGKAKYIQTMFTDLSGRYDRTSSTIAFNRDRFWRDFAASLVDGAGERILDVCCGTGELTVRLLEKTKTNVFAVDFCAPMVKLAKKKYGGIGVADIERLPFSDETFTCVTVAFALRNVSDISRSILEMYRVLKGGGKLIILDLGKPTQEGIKKEMVNIGFKDVKVYDLTRGIAAVHVGIKP
jgi:demethylmenaquinone methyltransferase/2-methoxy-6-polyprenyl-1,4-benzoquinol methylase